MVQLLGNELLRGEHVYLNRIVRDDLPLMTQMWSDIGFLRQLSLGQAYPRVIENMEDWYKHMGDDNAAPAFAIRLLADSKFIGACGFKDIRWQSRESHIWIGIGEEAQRGRGYGSDALRILLRYAFMEMNLNSIHLQVLSFNERAIAAYRKIGFQQDGCVRAFMYHDHEYHDMLIMSVLRNEWNGSASNSQPQSGA